MENSHQSQSLKLLHHFQVSPSPPPSAVANLPLTFLDYPWLLCRPMQRLFFYDPPLSTLQFTQTILPRLTTSLSAALHHFFPLAGHLISPAPPHRPCLRYSDGDSVPLTVAESGSDFDQMITNDHPRDARELRPFVPEMPDSTTEPDGTKLVPLLAVQITLFPGKGVCIGCQFAHVATDGMGFHHFVKFWASLFRSLNSGEKEDKKNTSPTVPSPARDRELIRGAYPGLESVLLNQWFEFGSSWDFDSGPTHYRDLSDKVRSTFVITRTNIERMKLWVRRKNPTPFRLSAFVVTTAFIWANLVKSQAVGDSSVGPDGLYRLSFVADCRQRLQIGLPPSYLGNCLGIYYVSMKKSDAVGEHGFAVAAEAIGRKVEELESGGGGLLRGAERWAPEWKELSEEGRLIAIAGSPRLKVYETDFGWGKPRKSEVVQVDCSPSVALCESRDGGGGVEVGLAMTRSKMEVFSGLFHDFLGQIEEFPA
ncbi:unnamed protein product [Linum trigynum]|uniref:Anthocyanin acyltransferase n=1 Tax=Linum trigynum TaxID=586398 RepID=A0AAV2GFU4_9ROSI